MFGKTYHLLGEGGGPNRGTETQEHRDTGTNTDRNTSHIWKVWPCVKPVFVVFVVVGVISMRCRAG